MVMATGLQLNLNRVIGRTDPSTFLDAQGAANVWLNTNLLNSNLATGTDTLGNLTSVGVYNGTAPNTYTTSSSFDYSQSPNKSIRVSPDVGALTIPSMSVGSVTQNNQYLVSVKPNTTYTLSFYSRTAIPLSNTVSLIAVPQQVAGTSLAPVTLTSTTAVSNTGWTKLIGQFTTSSNHNYLAIRATVTAPNLIGQTYYFDTFSLREGSADGTNNLALLGALNAKAGTTGLGLNAVCNVLAGTTNLDADAASELFS